MAKIMRKNNFKIQMLAGNELKVCVCASFEISLTLVGNPNSKCAWLPFVFRILTMPARGAEI